MKLNSKEIRLADTLKNAMIINDVNEQARKNIAIAVGHMLQNQRDGFNLDLFVVYASVDVTKVKV